MARASGWTYLTKITQLICLIVVAGVVTAAFAVPYFGGAAVVATKAVNRFDNTVCPLNIDAISAPAQGSTMYASDGKTEIATFFDENRQIIDFGQMPKVAVIDALVSTEDKRFYDHHGVDLKGLIRAALKTSNGNTQGGSTLTEQYVKQINYYSAISKGDQAAASAAINQDANRKISDAKCALAIEKKETKAQILQGYLNIAYFGESAYGIERAAETYFGVHASQLTIAQGAMIVGLVKAPSSFDPFADITAARARRDLVISNMLDQKYISAAEAATAMAAPIKLAPQSLPPRGCAFANPKIINVGFFCDYAYKWLTTLGGLAPATINNGGLKIVTSLQVGLQNNGEVALTKMGDKTLDPKNAYLLAMPSVKPSTGEVTSMITDKKYGIVKGNPAYTVNPIFTAAYAGSGSTYKYFTALAALKAGAEPNLTLTAPSPYSMKVCSDPSNQAYHPSNAGTNYPPTEPLGYALPASSNTFFVGMEDQFFGCNIGPIVSTATSLGMNALLVKNTAGKTRAQALVDGQSTTFTLGQEGTSALELTGAFATLANDGVFCQPRPINAITNAAGAPVAFTQATCTRQYTSYVARTLVNIMVNDTHSGIGTAGGFFGDWYNNGGSLVAAKTGTNNASDKNGNDNGLNSALWFVGMTPNLTSAAALVNPSDPNRTIGGVPGITARNDGSDTFGAYAANYWLAAYQPVLIHQQWQWNTVQSTPGTAVPVVSNLDPTTAATQLAQAGFRASVLPNETCGSKITPGYVAYYSPKIAEANAVISLCLSSGVAPVTPPPPVKTRPKLTPTPPAQAAPVVKPTVKPTSPVVRPTASKPPGA